MSSTTAQTTVQMGFSESNDTATVLWSILEPQLGLSGQQRVVIYNAKWNIPSDGGVYVVVRYLWSKAFGASHWYDGDTVTPFNEHISMNVREHFALEILSRGADAFTRKHELLMALNSTFAEQTAEANFMKFASISTDFRDTSYQDGAAIINRYSVDLSVIRAYERIVATDYFDTFTIPPSPIYTNP